MTTDSISEETFLITELRYTLGQLHVQVLDLDSEARKNVLCGDRSIDEILQDLIDKEGEYRARYEKLLGTGASAESADVPLPVSHADEAGGLEHDFEEKRAQTIALLENAGETWPDDLRKAVLEHVQHDRQVVTEIAECRKSYFESDQRPDLDQPLTTDPQPSPQTPSI